MAFCTELYLLKYINCFVGCFSGFLLFPCLNYFVWDETSETRNLRSRPVRGGQTVRKYGKSFMFQTSISWLAIEMTGQKINEKWKCIAKLFSRFSRGSDRKILPMDKRPRKSWQFFSIFYFKAILRDLLSLINGTRRIVLLSVFITRAENVFFSVSSFYTAGICFRSNKVIASRFRYENIKKASIYL